MDMLVTIVFITALAYLVHTALYSIRVAQHGCVAQPVEEEPEPTRAMLEAEKVALSQWRLHEKWQREGGSHMKDNR